jgi:transcriptional regulator with XRE-family HTH domain
MDEKQVEEIRQRIKKIRKHFDLNQTDFGKRFGVSQAVVTNMEKGFTGMTDRNLKAICAAYNINENWLLTGKGEMFKVREDTNYLDEMCKEYGLDGAEREVFERYLALPHDLREKFADWLLSTFDFVESMELKEKSAVESSEPKEKETPKEKEILIGLRQTG